MKGCCLRESRVILSIHEARHKAEESVGKMIGVESVGKDKVRIVRYAADGTVAEEVARVSAGDASDLYFALGYWLRYQSVARPLFPPRGRHAC